ncbi:hypothetical protein B0H13DRAFT_1908425 [Mycena leptocephala]|nr:hypothetical protein B0H13DRAFT_1908425 [Mycena leptocephala]
MSYYSNQSSPKYASIADLILTQKLNLTTSEFFYEYLDLRKNVSLHDLENILSTVVASMFWAVGNTPPLPQWYVESTQQSEGPVGDDPGISLINLYLETVNTTSAPVYYGELPPSLKNLCRPIWIWPRGFRRTHSVIAAIFALRRKHKRGKRSQCRRNGHPAFDMAVSEPRNIAHTTAPCVVSNILLEELPYTADGWGWFSIVKGPRVRIQRDLSDWTTNRRDISILLLGMRGWDDGEGGTGDDEEQGRLGPRRWWFPTVAVLVPPLVLLYVDVIAVYDGKQTLDAR